jgi:hypothetical protein
MIEKNPMDIMVYILPRVFEYTTADMRDIYYSRYGREFICSHDGCKTMATRIWFRLEAGDDEYDDLVSIGASCELISHFPAEDAKMTP